VRAVIDANVAISGAMNSHGASAEIIRAWEGADFVWITSASLIDELSRALRYPRVVRVTHWDDDRIERFLSRLKGGAIIAEPTRRIDVCRDPDDNRVLEAAVAGGADYIVSGDADLIALASFEGIAIITPAQFVAVLAAGG
jgi:putative PIN family toxin of toxin-antitoxin system